VVVRRAAGTPRKAAAVLALALTAAGCSHGGQAPPQVKVLVGGDTLALDATQYCADGTGHRYDVRPPVVSAAPDTRITVTVPDAVAARGWSVQVFDQHLQQSIGEVRVARGKAVFDGITTSDVVPAAFYLVVVEDKSAQCHDLSGAWPVGFIRAGAASSSSTSATSSGAAQG
jgi:hypothetical protein